MKGQWKARRLRKIQYGVTIGPNDRITKLNLSAAPKFRFDPPSLADTETISLLSLSQRNCDSHSHCSQYSGYTNKHKSQENGHLISQKNKLHSLSCRKPAENLHFARVVRNKTLHYILTTLREVNGGMAEAIRGSLYNKWDLFQRSKIQMKRVQAHEALETLKFLNSGDWSEILGVRGMAYRESHFVGNGTYTWWMAVLTRHNSSRKGCVII